MSSPFSSAAKPNGQSQAQGDRHPAEYPTYSFGQLLTHQFPAESNAIVSEGILKNNALWGLLGAPKAHKSLVAGSLAIDLVTGRNLFGAHRIDHGRADKAFAVTRQSRVLWLENEIGAEDLRERLAPAYQSLSPEEQALMRENLFTHSFDHSVGLDSNEGFDRLANLVSQFRPNILMLDPLCEYHTGNENDTHDMTTVMRAFDWLRERFEPLACIFSHHEGHQMREGISRSRGSSVVPAKIDTGLNLRVINASARLLACEFTLRRAKPIRAFRVQINAVNLRAEFKDWGTPEEKTGQENLFASIQ